MSPCRHTPARRALIPLMTSHVIISRSSAGEIVNGQARPERVYILTFRAARGNYGSTEDKAQATRFSPDEAQRIIQTVRSWKDVQIEPA